jgi:hypothetical protein
MSEVPVWNCEFAPETAGEGTSGSGVALDSLTVGAHFDLKCHGDIPVQWDKSAPTTLAFAKPEDEFTLAILTVKRQEPNEIDLVVTAYKAGQHNPDYVRILQSKGTAEEKGIEFAKPSWDVKSVLDPKQPAQPIGPYGPWNLTLPMWFWLVLAIVIMALVYFIFSRFKKFQQKRRLREELARHKTAVLPLHQFYKDCRNLRRRVFDAKYASDYTTIAGDLNREFRLYVLRKFEIPTLDWSNSQILRELKRRHRHTYAQAGEPLRQALRELTKLSARSNLTAQDVEQVQRMSLDAAERLDTGGRR